MFVAATPIDVSTLLRERLFEPFETIILTSATLAVGGRFDFLKQRLGVNMASERVLRIGIRFLDAGAALCSGALPDVRDSAFPERAAQEIIRLLEISRGRAFCLFTSYSQMNDQYERVRTRVRFPLLLQGSAPRTALLEKFRNTEGAVLFATSSFWQGVDVRGEQLSCVIVDRLPFAVPSDPIVAARVRALQDDGRNPFAEYQVPEAVLALKQGFGRLIRARTDRGVLAILDNRIQRMQYGKIFMESLPAYATTRDIAAVERFMQKSNSDCVGGKPECSGPHNCMMPVFVAPASRAIFPDLDTEQECGRDAGATKPVTSLKGKSMFQVSVDESFSAGHALRGYKGKCENVHGHNYKVRVTLEGPELDSIGLLYDFTHLKRVIRDRERRGSQISERSGAV